MSTANQSSSFQWRSFETASMNEVSSTVEKLGRAGYFAKGLVYLIVGLTTLGSTFGMAREPASSSEAIRKIGEQPFGRVLLGLIAVALLGYFLWRAIQAIKDTEAAGSEPKGLIKRTGYFISGLTYAGLGCFAGSLALGLGAGGGSSNGSSSIGGSLGGGSSGGGSTESQVKSSLMQETWGQVLIGIVGVIVIATAIYFIYKGWTAKFMSKYSLSRMSETMRKVALHAGRTGLILRGIAFAIVGWFIVKTAMNGGSGEGEFEGISDAINWLATQPFGLFLVGTMGFGLACFGVHSVLLGYYRRFNVSGS